MPEHEHHDGESVLARLDQLPRDLRECHERERQGLSQRLCADALETLRRLNRGEAVEVTAEVAKAAPWPDRDAPDDQLDVHDANVAAFKQTRYRELTTGQDESRVTRRLDYDERTGVFTGTRIKRGGWSKRRVIAVARSRPQRGPTATRRPAHREARPGQHGRRARRHAATSLRDDGDPPGGESDPDPWPWLSCADLSAAEAQSAADRIAAACGGFVTPAGLRLDAEAIWPRMRGEARTAAVIAMYVRLPRPLREQHDRAVPANREGGRR